MKLKTIITLIKSNLIYIVSFVVFGIVLFVIAAQIETDHKLISTILNSCGATLITIGVLSSWIEILNAGKLIDMISLFGDHKDEGIVRLFPIKNPEYKELRSSLLQTCKTYKATSLVGRQYIDGPKEVEETIELAKRCSAFELLFMDSSTEGYKYRYAHQEKETPNVIGRSEEKQREIRAAQDQIKESLKGEEKKSVKHYKTLSPFNFEMIDDYLFVSFYGNKAIEASSPVLLLKKSKGSKSFQYFINQYDYLSREST